MRFSKCMGLATKGFEEEIVDLITRLSEKGYKDKGKRCKARLGLTKN